jgi:hypothetical protein
LTHDPAQLVEDRVGIPADEVAGLVDASPAEVAGDGGADVGQML